MNIAKDFAQYLQSLGFGSVGTDIFYGDIPTSPDKCIVVFENEGQENEETGSFNPGVQIFVRSKPNDYDEARELVHNVYKSLIKIGNAFYEELASGITINETKYFRVYPYLGVKPLVRDSNNRIQFTQNYLILK